jgi:asparagine synthase (glutamine-hydrolysing)
MKLARTLGYTVIIDGQGADEVLAGYKIYFQAFQHDAYQRRQFGKAWLNGFLHDRRLRKAARSYVDVTRRFALRDSLTREELGGFWKGHVQPMVEQYGTEGLPVPQRGSSLPYELGLNLLYTSLPSNLFSGDRNGMAHSIENRYPYLDYELVDFCTHLPSWAYIDRGWQKMILRLAGRDLLPEPITWRVDKVGFIGPQDRWLRQGSLRDWAAERLFDGCLADVNGYDRAGIERLWKLHQDAGADVSGDLWRWASTAELLDMHRAGVWRYSMDDKVNLSPRAMN